jgi:hypothetical protein
MSRREVAEILTTAQEESSEASTEEVTKAKDAVAGGKKTLGEAA